MIRKKQERIKETKPSPFGGLGEITVRNILNGPEELYEKGRVFVHTTVYPGSEIGYHTHINESETYYILSGTAEFNDNGSIVILSEGDVAYTPSGSGHSIKAIGDETVEMIALILYK